MDINQLRLWKLFIWGRCLVTGFLLFIAVLIDAFLPQHPLQSVILLFGVQFLANGVYLYLWRKRDILFLGYVVFSLEIVLISLLIFFLGRDGYVFMLAYLWPIMMGGRLIGRRAIPPLTLLTGLSYYALLLLQRRGLVFDLQIFTASGVPFALALSLPYLAFLSLLIWLLTYEMERGEERLQHERNLLRSILVSMEEGLFVVDDRGQVMLSNEAAAVLLGICDEQSLPLELQERLEVDARSESNARQVLEIGDKTVSISQTPLPAHGDAGPARIFVARDITREAQAERMKSDFVSYVSHELRTPLTTIKTLTSILVADTAQDSPAHEYLQIINAQVERQLNLVKSLLDLDRLEAGRYDLPLEMVDPRKVIDAALQVCRPLAEAKELSISIVKAQTPSFVSNCGGLEQVLVNLLSNAVKFTPNGGHIEVSCASQGDEVVLAIRDSGIGIEPEQLDRLFVKYYTAHCRGTPEGTGLGLVIANMIVAKLGGYIDVTSQVGAGSRFAVHLPLRLELPN